MSPWLFWYRSKVHVLASSRSLVFQSLHASSPLTLVISCYLSRDVTQHLPRTWFNVWDRYLCRSGTLWLVQLARLRIGKNCLRCIQDQYQKFKQKSTAIALWWGWCQEELSWWRAFWGASISVLLVGARCALGWPYASQWHWISEAILKLLSRFPDGTRNVCHWTESNVTGTCSCRMENSVQCRSIELSDSTLQLLCKHIDVRVFGQFMKHDAVQSASTVGVQTYVDSSIFNFACLDAFIATSNVCVQENDRSTARCNR